MGCAITRIVKFLRRGEKGNSLITAVTELRRYTQAQWQGYGKVGTKINWTGINNASDMKIGDTIVINGVVTDKENISVSLYGTIVAINGTSVEERATALIMSGERGIQGIQGLQGPQGEQGIPGSNGTNGNTSYFHIKYSSVASPTSASQMTETPSTYIGTYVDFTANDSNDPKKYTWHRFEGMQGPRGIPGVGTDGKTTYLHIKYSNDGGKTFTANSGETPGAYIGVCTDFTENDPTSVSSYTWSKIKGEPGSPGTPGEKGDRGPALRGPQDFSSLPTDYQFYQGADDEPYVDIVYYNGSYYKCVWTHKKRSDDISSSNGLSGKYWVLSDKVEMIATKILLASYALIKNLGVEAIEMKDGSDNIVFRAKDGKVICKSGTFENVTVIGNITAQSIRLHVTSSNSNIDGAVACGAWNNPIVLPELSDGECMNLKIYAPYGTRSSPDASVKPENSKVQIWVHGSEEIAQSKEIGLGKGLFDAVGIGGGSYTIWAIR